MLSESQVRLLKELESVGIKTRGYHEGQPRIVSDPHKLSSLVIKVHEPDKEVYLTANLNESAKELLSEVGSQEAADYSEIQGKTIRKENKKEPLALVVISEWISLRLEGKSVTDTREAVLGLLNSLE